MLAGKRVPEGRAAMPWDQAAMSSRLEVVYRDLKKEHGRVMEHIDRLRALDSESGLVTLLDRLRTLLIVHFAREQLPDGFYDALGERARQKQDEIRVLTGDHAAILSTLNTLIEDAESPGAGDNADLLGRAHRLADQVLDHEMREHRFASELLDVEPST